MKGDVGPDVPCPLCPWVGHPRSVHLQGRGDLTAETLAYHSIRQHLSNRHPELTIRERSMLAQDCIAGLGRESGGRLAEPNSDKSVASESVSAAANPRSRLKRVIVLVGPDGKPDDSPEPPPRNRNPLYFPHNRQDAADQYGIKTTCREEWVKEGSCCSVCGKQRRVGDRRFGYYFPPETRPQFARGAIDQVAAYLDSNPAKTFTAPQIARWWRSESGRDMTGRQASQMLSLACRMGKIERIDVGLYCSIQNEDGLIVRFGKARR